MNLMTLMALSLCIGLLVDDAIVVRENIVRHAAMGKSHYQAALDGTNEIGLAVISHYLNHYCGVFTCCVYGRYYWSFLLSIWRDGQFGGVVVDVCQFYLRPDVVICVARQT
jgi:HAE1 family hydrophobic/amphiphilic exporter-1